MLFPDLPSMRFQVVVCSNERRRSGEALRDATRVLDAHPSVLHALAAGAAPEVSFLVVQHQAAAPRAREDAVQLAVRLPSRNRGVSSTLAALASCTRWRPSSSSAPTARLQRRLLRRRCQGARCRRLCGSGRNALGAPTSRCSGGTANRHDGARARNECLLRFVFVTVL